MIVIYFTSSLSSHYI